jgi:integrase/recombinase XerD
MTSSGQITDFGAMLQAFFAERLVRQLNVSPRTVESYRDTFRLLLRYAQQRLHRMPHSLTLEDVNASVVSDFLDYLEKERGNCVRSRDARLAAIHSFYKYVGQQKPERLRLAQEILALPSKRFEKPVLTFLSKEEMKSVLAAPDISTWAGRRDSVMFSLLYNTGARVSELAKICVEDAELMSTAPSVRLHGKGRKQRTIPLWRETVALLRSWIKAEGLRAGQLLFCNRFNTQLTRSAVAERFALAVTRAREKCTQMRGRHITCHTVRHTTAMHMLQGGIDIAVISLWLGHESIETTMQYVEADLKMKERALKAVAPPGTRRAAYKPSDPLLHFLESL